MTDWQLSTSEVPVDQTHVTLLYISGMTMTKAIKYAESDHADVHMPGKAGHRDQRLLSFPSLFSVPKIKVRAGSLDSTPPIAFATRVVSVRLSYS